MSIPEPRQGAPSIWARSPRHDDSVAIVHAVQPQQMAVLSGPHARLEIATKLSDSRLNEFRRQRRERRAGRPDLWIKIGLWSPPKRRLKAVGEVVGHLKSVHSVCVEHLDYS